MKLKAKAANFDQINRPQWYARIKSQMCIKAMRFGDVVPQKVRPNTGLDSVHMQNDFICVGPASQPDMTVSYTYNV
jgi:hypothetical protein